MSLDQEVRLLSGVAILQGMEPEALRFMAFAAEQRALSDGETIATPGEAADAAIVVLEGALAIVAPGPAAGSWIAEPGETVDHMAMFVSAERGFHVRSVGASRVLMIPRALMLRVLGEFPVSAEAVRASVSRELDALTSQLNDVADRLLASG